MILFRVFTGAGTNHLTSFATGFAPHPNTINFKFIFAMASFKDNMTTYMLLLFTFLVYFCLMIWAAIKDRKDLKAVSSQLVCPTGILTWFENWGNPQLQIPAEWRPDYSAFQSLDSTLNNCDLFRFQSPSYVTIIPMTSTCMRSLLRLDPRTTMPPLPRWTSSSMALMKIQMSGRIVC